MQVEQAPAPAIPELLLPQPVESTNGPPAVPAEVEQPTFHVMQPPAPSPAVPTEPTAPPPSTFTQLIAVPIAPAPSMVTSTPLATTKQTKRGSRNSHANKQLNRSPAKQATILARPSTGKTSTILPQPQKAVVLSNQMTPLVPKVVSTNGQVVKPNPTSQTPGFITYLVVDGNQGQFVQVPSDAQKPTFQNQAGQILQATPMNAVSVAGQTVVYSFPANGDSPIMPHPSSINTFSQPQQTAVTSLATQQSHQNSSQTVTTVRTSASIDMQRMIQQQQTTHTSDTSSSSTTTMTTQQLTGITQLPVNGCNLITHQPSLLQPTSLMPTSILNSSTNVSLHDREMSPIHNDGDSSLDDTSALDGSMADNGLSLSLSQIARKANHRHRRSSSSSLSKKKRGRPRLYERDPFTNKPIKSRLMPDGIDPVPTNNTTTTTLLMPGQTTTTTTFNGCGSLLFPNPSINHTTQLPVSTPSLLQQHHQPNNHSYVYTSLLNGNTPSTNMLTAPTMNIFSNTNNNHTPSSFPYSSPAVLPQSTPTTTFCRPFIPSNMTHTLENQATIPLKNLQISSSSSPSTSSPLAPAPVPPPPLPSTTVPNVVQLNTSPIKPINHSQNNDIVVHYIGGFVIRESSRPFTSDSEHDDEMRGEMNNKEKENNHSTHENNSDIGSDQLRCLLCKKVDFAERFFNQEKNYCSKSCSMKATKLPKVNGTKKTNNQQQQHDKTPPISEPTRIPEIPVPQPQHQPVEEQIPLPPDHGLPADPSKWTVFHVGEFIARLTNETIRDAFYESEMDGQALLLMTQEHLRDTMKIKLGPSLIISSEITKLRERARTFSS